MKAYRGSPGILEVTGRARGRMESWQKWSFPFSPLSVSSGDPAGWRAVGRGRHISRFSPGSGGSWRLRATQEPGRDVELTEIHASGQDW